MKRVISIVAIAALSGCADHQIKLAETRAHQDTSLISLSTAASYADRLSKEYMDAAAKVTNAQDAMAFLTLAAAGSVAVGAAGTTSNAVLAKRGVAGAMSSQVATRTSSKPAIQSIYQASKQLNCISTIAQIGATFGLDDDDTLQRVAVTLTHGAIGYVRISARESVVRDVADYSTVLGSLNTAIERSGGSDRTVTLREASQSIDDFAKLLATCTATSDPKPTASVN